LKTKISTILLSVILTLSALIVALPLTNAQTPEKITHAYLGAIPNPVGINQEALLHIGITDYLLIATDGWKNLTVSVTKPDGSTETLGPFTTDSTGGTGTLFIPTMAGTYRMQTHFPEQDYTWVSPPSFDASLIGTITYKASVSDVLELVVQQEPIEFYPGSPLPSDYWVRPIDAQHREWSVISGDWVADPPNYFAQYNDYAPESAHILWAKPLTLGGVVGGELGNHAYDCGDAYRGKWNAPVIINGVVYYNRFMSSFSGSMPQQGIIAVDLHTGEELWSRNNTVLSFGQTMYWSSLNMHGAFAYLWETQSVFDPVTFTSQNNWIAYDPFTGEKVYTMTNVPATGQMFGASLSRRGPNGEILIYEIDQANGWMTLWNSSNIPALWGGLDPESPMFGFMYYSWVPEGKTVDARGPCTVSARTPLGISGYHWNVSIPKNLPGGVSMVLEDRIIGSTLQNMGGRAPPQIVFWAISTAPGHEGALLFNRTWTTPPGDLEIDFAAASVEDGVFTVFAKETRAHYAFDIDTGVALWGPTPSQNYLDNYYATTHNIAYGKLFSAGASGIVYCYDVTTGTPLWETPATDPYNEILWANSWWMRILFIADGKIYLNHEEHSPIDPKPRGAPFICLNTTNGDVIWRIDGAFRGTHWGGRGIIGDSIIAIMNTYDQRAYAIGKGPSAVTVSAPDMGVPLGSSVTIKGMVTDESPGTKEYVLTARFPKGVPAVSDESMSEWMKYVYMQFAPPTDTTGVPVKIEVVDANMQYSWIGTATSDATGNFAFSWKPTVEGPYIIIATFDGSAAYYGSHAVTYMTVDSASADANLAPLQGSVENLEATTSNLTTYLLAILVLVIVTIAIAIYILIKTRK